MSKLCSLPLWIRLSWISTYSSWDWLENCGSSTGNIKNQCNQKKIIKPTVFATKKNRKVIKCHSPLNFSQTLPTSESFLHVFSPQHIENEPYANLSIPVGSRLFMCHAKGMSQLVQHGAHRIAAGRLQIQPLGLAMRELPHVGPTARVFLG